MARDAEDCALMLDAMTGLSLKSPLSVPPIWDSAYDIVSRTDNLRGVRIGYAPELGRAGIDPEVARLCRDAALGLQRHGAAIEEIAVDFSDGRDAFITLRGESMVGNHLARVGKLDALDPNLAGNIRLGLEVKIGDIARAEHKRAEIWHRWRALFERFDLVLTPTCPVLPFPVEQNYPFEIAGRKLETYIDWVAQTFLVSLAALPAASVPAGLSTSSLPVGLQIVGPRFSEPRLLACAKLVERDRPIGWAPHAA
jgi:amidase